MKMVKSWEDSKATIEVSMKEVEFLIAASMDCATNEKLPEEHQTCYWELFKDLEGIRMWTNT